MKKIIAIAGSNNKHSQTYRLLNMWLRRMAELDPAVQYEVFLLRDFPIALCEGCGSCSDRRTCALDQEDAMSFLRKKMQECHVIIFSSPVYHQNMSGIMKNFIDRTARDARSFAAAGKLGFTLTTTGSSGGKLVSDMLWQVQTRFGIKNIDNFIFRAACDDELAASERWARAAVEDMKYQTERRVFAVK